MSVFEKLSEFAREYSAIMDHARTGHAPLPRTRSREKAVGGSTVDGWYNSYAGTIARTHRK